MVGTRRQHAQAWSLVLVSLYSITVSFIHAWLTFAVDSRFYVICNIKHHNIYRMHISFPGTISHVSVMNKWPNYRYLANIVSHTSPKHHSNSKISLIQYNTMFWQLQILITAHTVYPKKYAHGFVVLCFVVVMQSFIINSHEVFIHIHQGCFAGTGAIVRLPQCQWSKPGGYGKISQCITTTKHSIFIGIYCNTPSLVHDQTLNTDNWAILPIFWC